MGSIGKYFALALILTVAISGLSLITLKPANAQSETITKDFGEVSFNAYKTGVICKIDVTVTIQSEPNGNWIINHEYGIDWSIRLTYLNQSMYDSKDFSIVCYNPQNRIAMWEQMKTYNTTVTLQNEGNLALAFRPTIPWTFELDSFFTLTFYYKGNIVSTGDWVQPKNQLIDINIVSDQQANTTQTPATSPTQIPTPTIIVPIVLVVVLLIAIVSLLLYRRHRRAVN